MIRRGAFLVAAAASPFLINRPVVAQTGILADGTFRDGDPVLRGSGDLRITQAADGTRTVELLDMKIVPGPNLFVYLVEEPDPLFPEDVTAKFRSLGKLKGLTGDQECAMPADVALTDWGSVVVWCDTVRTAFAVATINKR